jgi:glycosyltransferase involved in cell wall biosynthesis
MKIIFATEYYHPFVPGGTPWSLRLLARELVQQGEDVAIVTPNYGAPPKEDVDGVPVFRFPFWRKLPAGLSLAPARDHVNPLFHLLLARAVVSVARRFGADVIHAQEKHALVGAFLAGRWLGRPVFLTLRDFGLICPITTCLLAHSQIPADCGTAKLQRECAPFYLDHYIGGRRLRQLRVRAALGLLYLDAWLKGAIVKRVDGVIGVSQSILEIYRRAGRIGPGEGRVVYNLAPAGTAGSVMDRARALQTFGLPDRPLVLYVGKRSPGKGFPVFLEAARSIAARVPEACFVVVGAGAPVPDQAGADVRLLGSRLHSEVETLYALARVVVHPAVWPEPFSRVPLEAGAFGKPVVGTKIGGTPEAILDRSTGLLVERNDPQALADAVVTLLTDAPTRQALGENARAFVANKFAPDTVIPALLSAYRDAMG